MFYLLHSISIMSLYRWLPIIPHFFSQQRTENKLQLFEHMLSNLFVCTLENKLIFDSNLVAQIPTLMYQWRIL